MSHRVPAGGIPAWDRPDPTLPPATTLAGDVPLEVLHQQDDGWCHVRAENGWTGWVDGRRLTAVAATRPAVEPLALLGAAAALAGSFLPWFTYRGASASAWKTPLLFLLAGTGADDQVKCGPLFLVMILLALPLVTGRPMPRWASVALAGVASAAGAIAVAHALVGTDPPSVGVGVVVTLAGGLLLSMAAYPDRTPVKRVRRTEAGDVVLGGLVVFGLLAGAAFLSYTAFLSLREASLGWRPGGGATATQAPLDLNVGPPPPSEGRDCIVGKMASSPHRFQYTANGWRSDDFPMPALTGDRSVDRGAISVWKAGFEGFVGSELNQAITVCQRPAQTVAPTTTTTTLPVSFAGLYRLEYINTRQCTLPSPDPMARVVVAGGNVTITFSPSNGQIRGALDADGRFDAALTQGAAIIRAQGTFVPFGERVLIRNGLLTLNQAGLACEFTFTGERVGN